MQRPNTSQTNPTSKQWFTEAETAQRLGMSQKWLQAGRLRGSTLRFAKFGGAVRYCLDDIEQFERDCMRHSTSDPGLMGGDV